MADTFMEEGFGMMLRGLKAFAVVASLGFAGLAAPNAAYAWVN
ncbi:hypothetical protein [Pseudovibrio denitrificans]|nr:hypothetical protein [Pseudovibrio denitrificans]